MKAKAESKRNSMYRIEKRIFDILLSSLSLIVLAPLFLFIAIGVKLTGPGPVFFRMRRLGLDGKEIHYWKFRTMMLDAIEQGIGLVFLLQMDSRITRFGRFLRMTSLDELPTLIAVLKGDMSFVGPRPALPLEVEHYSQKQRQRLSVKPGLTGYWQTFGREKGIDDLDRMVEMDLEYLQNQSLRLDLKIIGRTILMSSLSKGAY